MSCADDQEIINDGLVQIIVIFLYSEGKTCSEWNNKFKGLRPIFGDISNNYHIADDIINKKQSSLIFPQFIYQINQVFTCFFHFLKIDLLVF